MIFRRSKITGSALQKHRIGPSEILDRSQKYCLVFPSKYWTGPGEYATDRSLRGRNDRSEKVGNRGQIFSILRCIVVLFAEKSRKYGPILPLSQ